jgi:lysophospholipase L1-like esterase
MFFPIRYIAVIMLIELAWGPAPAPAYLALGDSYTIGESVGREDRYPIQAVQMLRADHQACGDPEIIATTGWTTADLLKALPNKTSPASYAVVTLLIGVNNQYQGLSRSAYRDEFTSLLERSIQLAGNKPSHVIVLSIPDYSATPFARGGNMARIAAEIDSFNASNLEVSGKFHVHYLDITAESRKAAGDPSLIAVDGLHFSGKEYAIWAGMMEPEMKRILNDKQ